MARELMKYPDQLKVNLEALRHEYQANEMIDLSGYDILAGYLKS